MSQNQNLCLQPNMTPCLIFRTGEAALHMPMKEPTSGTLSTYAPICTASIGQGNGICDPPQTEQSFICESASREVVSLMTISFPVIFSLTRVEHKEDVLLKNTARN